MRRKRRAPTITRGEALAARPVRNEAVDEEHRTDDADAPVLRLVYAVRYKPWFGRLASKLGRWDERPMTRRLELDEMGTLVWRLIDGDRDVNAIIREFAAAYRLQPREAEVAVTTFIKQLGQRGVIVLREATDEEPEAASTETQAADQSAPKRPPDSPTSK